MNPADEPYYIGEHYLYDGFWYYYKFPVEWAKDHHEDTGPNNCLNCAYYGTLHNGSVFIGYCMNCVNVYEPKRGPGFRDVGKFLGTLDEESYLYNVDVDSIPCLLHDVSPPSEEQGEDLSILDCHFEGGYNDF